MLRDALLRRFPKLASLPLHSEAIGGAVRDLLLDVTPNDVDIECDDPLACASALGKVIPLGRGDLAVWRVVIDGRIYDFSGRTDLGRRDFTMNAVAIDLTTGEIRDPFAGQEDIRRGTVRMIAAQNLEADPLRMLRAVRLAVRFGFTIEEETVVAIRRRAERIVTMAAERVSYELSAIFSAGRFRTALRLLHETALDVPLFGDQLDARRFHADDVPLAAAYALLLQDPRAFAERWRWGDTLLREVATLQQLSRDSGVIALYDAGMAIARQLPPMLRAIGKQEVALPAELFATKTLLDGDEIAALTGLGPGPRLGAMKRALLEAQLRGEVRSPEDAERFLRGQA